MRLDAWVGATYAPWEPALARLGHGVAKVENVVLEQTEIVRQHGHLQPRVVDGAVRPDDGYPVEAAARPRQATTN